MTQTFTARDGARLAYADEGEGLPLLCLSGLTRTMGDFDYLRPHLPPLRLIRMDYRGRGASQWSTSSSKTGTCTVAFAVAGGLGWAPFSPSVEAARFVGAVDVISVVVAGHRVGRQHWPEHPPGRAADVPMAGTTIHRTDSYELDAGYRAMKLTNRAPPPYPLSNVRRRRRGARTR